MGIGSNMGMGSTMGIRSIMSMGPTKSQSICRGRLVSFYLMCARSLLDLRLRRR